VYLWQHEPCLFGWIKGAKPKTFRAQIAQTSDGFPTTVWHIPSAEVETDGPPDFKTLQAFYSAHGTAHRTQRHLPKRKVGDDIVAARLLDGLWFRVLTVADQFTHECLLLLADSSLTGQKVPLALSDVIAKRGAPDTITVI
jgi:hypothetical protein